MEVKPALSDEDMKMAKGMILDMFKTPDGCLLAIKIFLEGMEQLRKTNRLPPAVMPDFMKGNQPKPPAG